MVLIWLMVLIDLDPKVITLSARMVTGYAIRPPAPSPPPLSFLAINFFKLADTHMISMILADGKLTLGTQYQSYHWVGLASGTRCHLYHQIVLVKLAKTADITEDFTRCQPMVRLALVIQCIRYSMLSLPWNCIFMGCHR